MSNADAPVRLGLIGAGIVVEWFHLPVLSQMPSIRLAWVADPNLERARSVAATYRIPRVGAAYEDQDGVDAVLIATPVGVRLPIVRNVLARGWDAFCEKPFASSEAEHKQMLAAAEEHGRVLGVGLLRRYAAATQTARRLIKSGLLGPAQEVLAGEGTRARRTGRGSDWYQGSASASGGGVLFEAGSHLIDQMLVACDTDAFEIEACQQRYVADLEGETSARGTLRIQDRAVPFAVVVSRLRDIYNGIVVRCANGELRFRLMPWSPVELFDRSGAPIGSIPSPIAARAATHATVRAEWEEFLADRVASKVDLARATGLATTAFIDRCYQIGREARQAQGVAR